MNTNTNDTNNGLIAVTDAEAHLAGVMVHYTTSACSQELLARALGPTITAPELPTPATALRRAMQEFAKPRRLVRPVEGGGWTVVDELLDDAGVPCGLAPGVIVRLDDHGGLEFSGGGGSVTATEVRAQYDLARGQLDSADVSSWLIRKVYELNAIAARPKGGVYFVPQPSVAALRVLIAAVESAGAARVYTIPAMKSADAVRAIMDALVHEADGVIHEAEELAVSDAGKRARTTASSGLSTLLSKLGTYEKLLDARLESVRLRLANAQVALFVSSAAATVA